MTLISLIHRVSNISIKLLSDSSLDNVHRDRIEEQNLNVQFARIIYTSVIDFYLQGGRFAGNCRTMGIQNDRERFES